MNQQIQKRQASALDRAKAALAHGAPRRGRAAIVRCAAEIGWSMGGGG